MTPKDRGRLRQLHAMLGSSNAGERENAWKKVDACKHGKTWNDLPELLHDETAPSRTDPRDVDPSQPVGSNVTPLDLVRAMLEDYSALDTHEYVAAALWAVHTHVFDKFMVTPRCSHEPGSRLRQDHVARCSQPPSRSARIDR
jgi:hypothetical protein